MTFAAAYEDPPLAWGVGRIVVGDTITPWPVSARDIEDESESLAPRLAALGLGEGGLVLIVSLLSHTVQVNPLERAAGLLGALYSSSDRSPFDAFRAASLIRQLQPEVVMGIDGRVLDGLEEAGRDFADVFGSVPAVVAVDGDAAIRLRAAGIDVRRWVTIGPTSAIQGSGEDHLAYDSTRWQVDESHGELLLTNIVDRLTPCVRFATGVRGAVPARGRIVLEGG